MQRNTGLDLLKIIAMFMVLTLHILNASNLLYVSVENGNPNYWSAHFIDIAAYCAVDCFALITGFCSIDLNFKISRIIRIWMQVVFYTVGITTAYILVSHNISLSMLFRAFFPILSDGYRYFSQYFVCFLFTPFFNKIINSITYKERKILFWLIIIFFSCYALINIGSNTGGYHVLWLCILYIVGACMKKAELFKNISSIGCVILYFVCIIATFASKYINETFSNKYLLALNGGNPEFLTSYTSPTILFSAIFLVVLFARIDLKNKLKVVVSDNLTKTNFGVFIIHSHYLLWGKVIGATITAYSAWFMNINIATLIVTILMLDFLLYFGCTLVDTCRLYIFNMLKINSLCDKIGEKISTLLD